MSGTNYKKARGHTNRDGRNNPIDYTGSHQQYYAYHQTMESNYIDELISQAPSFTQLNISNSPMYYHHYGLGYSVSSPPPPATTTTTATSTSNTSMYTGGLSTRFVKASQNLPATDPSLQQQDSNSPSLNPDFSGKDDSATATATDSDTIIPLNNSNDNEAPTGTKIDTHTTNDHPQQEVILEAHKTISTANDPVPQLHDTASATLLPQPNGTACIGGNGVPDTQAAEEEDQQLYGNQHGGVNDDSSGYDYHDHHHYHHHHHNDNGDIQQQQQDEEDVFDFGLCDSDDDEYIQAYMMYQQQQQQYHDQMMMANNYPGMYTGPLQQQHYIPYASHQQSKPKYRWYEDSPSGQLRRVDRRIQLFISDPSRETYQLPAMSSYCRRQVQGLTTMYKLKMSPEDLGNNKIGLLLKKSHKTHLPADRRAIEKHINKIRTVEKAKQQMERRPGGAASETLHRVRKEERRRLRGLPVSDLAPTQSSSSSTSSSPTSTTATKKATKAAKKAIPRVVGSEAAPLASNNIGHRMMASMGWKEGDSLGVNNDGIADPIQPVIRTNRRGLGA